MRPTLLRMLGIPQNVQAGLSPRATAAVNRAMEEMNPMALRLPGIRLDEGRSLPFDLPSRVTAPTLVIHSEDDGLVSVRHALHTRELIKGSRLVTFATGGHFLAGRLDEAHQVIASFLATLPQK
jgi:pimeloyl-ACP methyl ester carboxylesterase